MIRQPSSESDFEEVNEDGDDELDLREKTSNLSKIAEAAGRKMKKLKTNWSIKKSDITRSLSRIKKTSRPALDMGIAPDGKLRQIGCHPDTICCSCLRLGRLHHDLMSSLEKYL